MKLVVDMNLSPRWVPALLAAGHDAVHRSAVGQPDAPDSELMMWAAGQGRVVLTADLDYPAILAFTRQRQPSVILLRSDDLAPESSLDAVLSALAQAETELAAGAVASVDETRARLRILPLGRG